MAELVASFRMYEATAGVERAWRQLFAQVFRDARLDMRIVDHRFPQPIETLWRHPALGCAFMCGWPFFRAASSYHAIAAPVPAQQRYAGLARYCSEFLVAEKSGWDRIEQTFGRRIGWMSADSHSGFNAPRHFLARYVTPGERLFSESKGPLGTPSRTLAALKGGDVDVAAVDGFFLDLCRRHDPARLEGLRTVARTEWAPIPMLVAARSVEAALCRRLTETLCSAADRASCKPLLEKVLVARFVEPRVEDYGVLEEMARFAVERGYPRIA